MMSSKDRAARRGVDAEVTDFNAAIKAQEGLAAQDRRRNDPVSPLDGVSADDWQYWLDYVGSGLTEREREVLELMKEGLTKKEIAARLELSFHTVDDYLRNIYAKLHVHSQAGAVAKAMRHKLF